MITLRKLQLKDVPLMLEWMHDEEAKHIFQNNFAEIDDVAAKKFVENSFREDQQHFAIVDDQDDEYLGTISLKNIDLKNKNAEYAISTRKKARGTGANQKATKSLLKYGFDKLQLHRIYLNVLSSNKRAISFYKKCGFIYEGKFKDHLFIDDRYQDLEWYAICKK